MAAALAEAAAAAGLAAAWRLRPRGVALTLRPGGDATWQWSRVLARRSSGLGPRGLAPDPRPLPPGVLAQLAAAAGTVPPGSPAGSGEELHHRLAVRGITGTSDGWYAVSRGAAGLRALAEPMAALPRAVGHAEGVADIAGMNVAWVMTAPLARTVRVAGAPGYQRLLLTAGAAAQHVGSAAATQGLFCRPMRNVREAALESAVDAPPDQDFVYLLLIGRSRVHDFPYDLSPPQLPAQASTGDSP